MAHSTTIKRLQELEAAEEAKAARGDRPRMVAAWKQDVDFVYGAIRDASVAYERRGLALIAAMRKLLCAIYSVAKNRRPLTLATPVATEQAREA